METKQLTYDVIIESEKSGMVRATVWGLPDCARRGGRFFMSAFEGAFFKGINCPDVNLN